MLSHTLYAAYHLRIRTIESVMAMYSQGIMASLLQQYTAFAAFIQEVFPEADPRPFGWHYTWTNCAQS